MAHAPPPAPIYHQHDHQHDNNIIFTPHHTTPPHPTPRITRIPLPPNQQQRHLFQQSILFNYIKYHSLNKFNTIDNNFTRRVNFLALFSDTLSQKQSESAAESFANSTFSSCWKTKYRHAQKVKY